MVDPRLVKQQLRRIGADKGMWCRAEREELPRLLFDGEEIHHLINGRYSGGFAVLCATNQRVLLVDKKPLYLTMEDIRYDMISDIMFNHRLVDATVLLGTMHKSIGFTAYNREKLRDMTVFIQGKILEFRQNQTQAQTLPSPPAAAQNEIYQAYDMPAYQAQNNIQPAQQIELPKQPNRNPYYMPVVIRNRASKYY